MMLCVTIIFGINGPFTKALLGGGLTPYTHMFCRFLGATILFWIASMWVPRERIDRKDWGKMVLASLTGIFFNQGLFAIGMSMTSPDSRESAYSSEPRAPCSSCPPTALPPQALHLVT